MANGDRFSPAKRKIDHSGVGQSARSAAPAFNCRLVEALDRVRAALRKRGTEASSIDDAIQQAALVLVKKRETFEHGSLEDIFRYALCVAENWLRNARRDTARRLLLERAWTIQHADGVRSEGDAFELLSRRNAAEVQLRSLECLDRELREVFLACHVGGLSAARGSKKLGIPEGTVKSRLKRARFILRNLCTDLEHSEPTTPFSPRKAAPRSLEHHVRAGDSREHGDDSPETAGITPRSKKGGTGSTRG